ncbi:ribonuclease R [Miniphocaeibacter halophilus]|uniref:Ribonuclease R n=1 Tax=Miniphocaeibacter halophilus TaxID=2931922 RepID=A0AC61MT36_9FIRM|nr:ribonuclease R [Miniphocaeibacter halophilus]QQK07770.1 ribonuclease R [Miniphocaeibacter halophilus]
MNIKNNIVNYISSNNYKPMTKEELALEFNIGIKEYRDFFKILKDLEKEGLLYRTKREKYVLTSSEGLYKGTLQGNKAGFAYFIEENKSISDVFISKDSLNGGKHKDRVLIRILVDEKESRSAEGEVVKIIEESKTPIVGTYKDSKQFGFVIPDDSKYGFDIFIAKRDKNGAKNNDKVVIKLKDTVKNGKSPEGIITSVLGNKNEKGVDISSIALEFQLPYEFSNKLLEKADKVPQKVSKEEIKKRKDFRDLFTVTIDGEDAKDFDDAVSIDKKGDNYILYVHIADVAHYVAKGSALDREAYKRGNSVYLLDRVIPMLPKQLSNGICSLNPNVDRLTITCKMEINPKGKVVDYKFFESVVNSDYRLVYEKVSDILENKSDYYNDDYLNNKLRIMAELFEILKDKRKNRGSIDFNFVESKIILDENGKAVDVVKEERRVANRIIEEFMIVTNETVGAHFGYMEEPFIYRVHIEPSKEKVLQFKNIIKKFGYFLKGQDIYSKDFQKILEDVKGKPEEMLVSTLLLRSLSKAEYSLEPDIHFGLSSMFYSHFTSPIRRYPDLFIHRILKNFIHNKPNTKNIKAYLEMIDEVAHHCSITERRAEEAEYEVNDMKMAEYMEQHIGEEFEGIISSLTNFGIFVQLNNGIEGLVQYAQMKDDYYTFNQESYIVVGETRNKMYNLGQQVTVKVIDASSSRRQIDFEFIN